MTSENVICSGGLQTHQMAATLIHQSSKGMTPVVIQQTIVTRLQLPSKLSWQMTSTDNARPLISYT